MIKHALFVRLEAKPGKEKELAQFLQTGLGMAQQEGTTPVWFALQLGGATFSIERLMSRRNRARANTIESRVDY
jgi:hypothetical protein